MRILEIITRVKWFARYPQNNHPNFSVKFDFKRKLNFLDQLICDDNLFVN